MRRYFRLLKANLLALSGKEWVLGFLSFYLIWLSIGLFIPSQGAFENEVPRALAAIPMDQRPGAVVNVMGLLALVVFNGWLSICLITTGLEWFLDRGQEPESPLT